MMRRRRAVRVCDVKVRARLPDEPSTSPTSQPHPVDCNRIRNPLARTARRAIAARTEASDPTTRTLRLARVTAVYSNSRVSNRESSCGISTVTSSTWLP